MDSSKETIYLILKTDSLMQGKDQESIPYSPLLKAARLDEVLRWNIIEFKDYMLDEAPDIAGDRYSENEKNTVDYLNGVFRNVESGSSDRADLYMVPKTGEESDLFMVRPMDTIADLAERIIQENVEKIDGKDITQKTIAGLVRVQKPLGGYLYLPVTSISEGISGYQPLAR